VDECQTSLSANSVPMGSGAPRSLYSLHRKALMALKPDTVEVLKTSAVGKTTEMAILPPIDGMTMWFSADCDDGVILDAQGNVIGLRDLSGNGNFLIRRNGLHEEHGIF
jgi:hypothetical protein